MTSTLLSANLDVDYVVKDFYSSEDAMINFATVQFGPGTSANRLWTDFNVSSFSRNWLEIVAFMSDIFFFYLDNQATQAYLQTATVYSAIANIAQQFGFQPASAASASGLATFTVTGAVTIPRGFQVTSTSGQVFYLTSSIVASAPGNYSGTVLQGTIVSQQFTAQGLQNEEFNLTGPNVVIDLTNINPLDITPQVTVNGNPYTLVYTFIYSNGTNTPAVLDSLGNVIGGGGRVFMLGQLPNGTPYIMFGDGVFGRELIFNEVVNITYRSGGGSAGNISSQTLTTLTSSNPLVSAVTNSEQFSGGADVQTLSQLQSLIPASLRTLYRAVTLQDYSDLLLANFSQVFAASASQSTSPGVDINVYVVPQGTGITSITSNPLLEQTLYNFIDIRKMVTTQFQILNAFGISTIISMTVYLDNTTSRNATQQAIFTALQSFFNLNTGGPNGNGISFAQPIYTKDIDAIIDIIPGITSFQLTEFSYNPRIQDNIVGISTTYITSPVSIFPNVEQEEWLIGASGPITIPSGTVIFNNPVPINFTYNSGSGLITYAFPVNLTQVSPGYLFRDGLSVDYEILAVDILANTLTIASGESVNTTAGAGVGGSIRTSSLTFNSFKCFKNAQAIATNLSSNSITDTNLTFAVLSGTGTSITPTLLLDNTNIFVPNQYSNGKYYLVDSSSNIWQILSNSSDTITTAVTAVNDASITSVSSGSYQIVNNLTGSNIVFSNEIFAINYNNANSIFSIGALFNQIGTIGDNFQISTEQNNVGNFGTAIDIVTYNSSSKQIEINGTPDLSGVNSSFYLIDSSNQIINITAVNNSVAPSVSYSSSNQNSSFVLTGSGLGSEVAQGFEVPSSGLYSFATLNLKVQGNIIGNLFCEILNDSGGLPNSSSIIATSNLVNINTISSGSFQEVVFIFPTPPSLSPATQYHLALLHDASYTSSYGSNINVFNNSGLVPFSYNSVTGVVTYSTSVSLSSVIVGNYFEDNAGNIFEILALGPNSSTQVTLATGLTVSTGTPSTAANGSIYRNDDVLVGVSTNLTYPNGEFSRYDSVLTEWSNSTLGPESGYAADAIFSIQGTKTITIDSNLTPAVGTATLAPRYYDDNNEISLIIGISNGTITSASNVNALGLGTVGGNLNSQVDNFVFRTSPYVSDITNLRSDEIPQLGNNIAQITLFGGVA